MKKKEIKKNKSIDYYMQLPYSVLLYQVIDDNETYWIAEIPDLPGCKSHGTDVEEAVNSVQEAKLSWIQDSIKHGDEVPEPSDRTDYSGKILVRMPRYLHRSLAQMAESEEVSLNQLIVSILSKEVGRQGSIKQIDNKLDNVLAVCNTIMRTGVTTASLAGKEISNSPLLLRDRNYDVENDSVVLGQVSGLIPGWGSTTLNKEAWMIAAGASINSELNNVDHMIGKKGYKLVPMIKE